MIFFYILRNIIIAYLIKYHDNISEANSPNLTNTASCFTHPTHFAGFSKHLVPFQQVVSHQLADFVLPLPTSLDHLHFCFCWRLPLKILFICRSVTAETFNFIFRFQTTTILLSHSQNFRIINSLKRCCNLWILLYVCFYFTVSAGLKTKTLLALFRSVTITGELLC